MLWFDGVGVCMQSDDAGQSVLQSTRSNAVKDKEKIKKKLFNDLQIAVQQVVGELPLYHWLTVLTQLISRICHESLDVRGVLHKILTQLLCMYPQQVSSISTIFHSTCV